MTTDTLEDATHLTAAGIRIPYGLTTTHFAKAAAGVDSLIAVINAACAAKGFKSLEELLSTPATLSALISDLYEGALEAAAPNLVTVNKHHNGHPDLVPLGIYEDDAVVAGENGVEVKATKNKTTDAHGARTGWWCQVRYRVGAPSRVPGVPAIPTRIRAVCLAHLSETDFRSNARNTATGTRTATPHKEAVAKISAGVVYSAVGL